MEWFVVPASLFVACVVSIALTFLVYKEDILVWYIRLWNEWQRDDYIEENRAKLERDLSDTLDDLVIYLDEEIDEAHLKKEQEFKREGRRYLFYLEKSYEVAILKGHCILFDERAVKKLMHMFWAPRWMLLRHFINNFTEEKSEEGEAMKVVERFICAYRSEYGLRHLRIDNETRSKERKRMTMLHNK